MLIYNVLFNSITYDECQPKYIRVYFNQIILFNCTLKYTKSFYISTQRELTEDKCSVARCFTKTTYRNSSRKYVQRQVESGSVGVQGDMVHRSRLVVGDILGYLREQLAGVILDGKRRRLHRQGQGYGRRKIKNLRTATQQLDVT